MKFRYGWVRYGCWVIFRADFGKYRVKSNGVPLQLLDFESTRVQLQADIGSNGILVIVVDYILKYSVLKVFKLPDYYDYFLTLKTVS